MKKYLFLLTFLLTAVLPHVFANLAPLNVKFDSTQFKAPIELKDSSKTADSAKVFKNQKTIKTTKMIISGALAAASAYSTLLFGFDANGYPMLFFGLLSIGFIISIFRIKKKKPKTYEELKAKESEPSIKTHTKFNKSWNFAFYIGLFSFFITVIAFLSGLSPGFLFLPLFLSSLLFFILGFKGKYESPKQFRKKLFAGFTGLLLHWLPYVILFALFVR